MAPSWVARWASSAASLDLPTPAGPPTATSPRPPSRASCQAALVVSSPASRPTMADRLSAANTASGGWRARVPRGVLGLGPTSVTGVVASTESSSAGSWRSTAVSRAWRSRAGIEAQLLAEALLGLRIRRQRVDLPARAVQRQHQLPAQPLVEGVGRDQLLQPPHHLPMLPEGERGGHGGLLRDHAKLPEPGDGGVGEVRRSEVAEHVAAPEGKGFAQKRGGVGGVADPERLLCALDQSREDLGIEVGRCERQKIPTGSGAERVSSTRGGQDPTYGTDVAPQRGRGAVGGGLAPHRGHQVLAAERPVGVEQQQRQQLPGPRAAQRQGPMPGVGHLEWPQDAEAGRRRCLLGGRFVAHVAQRSCPNGHRAHTATCQVDPIEGAAGGQRRVARTIRYSQSVTRPLSPGRAFASAWLTRSARNAARPVSSSRCAAEWVGP